MRRLARLIAIILVTTLALAPLLAPADAWARAGNGGSMGSRGSFTYSAPAGTATAPYSAQPMQRSMTPSPSYGAAPYAQPAYGARSGFMSGLLGGIVGVGLGSLLFGHGGFGVFGLILKIVLLVLLVRFVIRLVRGGVPAFAGPGLFGNGMARNGAPPSGGVGSGGLGAAMGLGGGGGRPATAPVSIGPADFKAFEMLLKGVQAAWTDHDMAALRGLCTPEMLSYFNEQLSDQASRGVRNMVTDVRLEQGDLAEAWAEQGREYATVAMRFSMLDVTRDGAGRVVDGSATVRSMATELWTFLRAPGGRWVLSAIQQAR